MRPLGPAFRNKSSTDFHIDRCQQGALNSCWVFTHRVQESDPQWSMSTNYQLRAQNGRTVISHPTNNRPLWLFGPTLYLVSIVKIESLGATHFLISVRVVWERSARPSPKSKTSILSCPLGGK